MQTIDRRSFLFAIAAAAATSKIPAQSNLPSAKIAFSPHKLGPSVPSNFVGLSYETQQLADPAFFSASNIGLITHLRALSPQGVLRIGGNTSDVGWWKPTPASKRPSLPRNVVLKTPPGERNPLDLQYAVTPEAIRNLRVFLDASGWTCIYGINLGTNTPDRAAEQAAFVTEALGPKLMFFQLGNEPDGFDRRFRESATWNATAYVKDWLATADAIRSRVPRAAFGLPDVAESIDWCTEIANRLTSLPNPPKIYALTHHYYFGGPPSDPQINIGNLLRRDSRITAMASVAGAAAEHLKTQLRMTEGNTCYRGGKPGVSDVFASSLWAADYLLLLATLGYSGVNIHGGSGKAVADSLGGTLPGELLMADRNAPHPRPFYTPIAEVDGRYLAEPIYFGMKFAQRFAGAQMLKTDFDPGSVNATAYAAILQSGQTIIAIINKDAQRDLAIHLPGFILSTTLTALSIDSKKVIWSESTERARIDSVSRTSAVLLVSAPREGR